MIKKKQDKGNIQKQSHPASPDYTRGREEVERAHRQADRDILADPEFSAHSPNDDLDEGETARLGEDIFGII